MSPPADDDFPLLPPKQAVAVRAIHMEWPETLVKELDGIAQEHGYSRRELAVYILTWGAAKIRAQQAATAAKEADGPTTRRGPNTDSE